MADNLQDLMEMRKQREVPKIDNPQQETPVNTPQSSLAVKDAERPIQPIGTIPTTADLIKAGQQELADLKAINEQIEAETLKHEKLRAQARMAGKGFVTQPVKIETAEEKWRREAKERYKGTGLDPT